MRHQNLHRDRVDAPAPACGAFARRISARSVGDRRVSGAHTHTPFGSPKVRAVCAPLVLASQRLNRGRARAHGVLPRWHGGAKGLRNDVSLCARHLNPYEIRPQCAHTIRKSSVRASTQAVGIKGRRARTTFWTLIVRAVRAACGNRRSRKRWTTARRFLPSLPCTLVKGQKGRKGNRQGGSP